MRFGGAARCGRPCFDCEALGAHGNVDDSHAHANELGIFRRMGYAARELCGTDADLLRTLRPAYRPPELARRAGRRSAPLLRPWSRGALPHLLAPDPRRDGSLRAG